MISFNYSDIYLVPKYSILRSRSEADIGVEFLGRKFKSPVIPANMSSVINDKIAKWLSQNDYFYIMHRFDNTFDFVQKANLQSWKTISISVGVKDEDKELLKDIFIYNYRIDFITIDIAHGHSILVKEMIDYIKATFSIQGLNYSWKMPKIIAGNIATSNAVNDLTKWGADACKVGIAGGGACSTKNQTAFHIPMFTCVKNCYEHGSAGIPIIADGGIRENGDIPKALVAGASMVMVGGLLAACIDAPGENTYSQKIVFEDAQAGIMKTENDEVTHKSYYGSASAKQKNNKNYIEGSEVLLLCNNMLYEEKYKEIKESLSSAVSYAGGKDLSAFKSVDFVSLK